MPKMSRIWHICSRGCQGAMPRYGIINYNESGGLWIRTNVICDSVIGVGKFTIADIIGKTLEGQEDHEFY